MRHVYSIWLGILIGTINLAAQQSHAALPSSPWNLDFGQGSEPSIPPYWEVSQRMADAGYSAELRRQGCPSNIGCLVLNAPAGAKGVGQVVNTFDATTYRNLSFQVRALVKLEGGPNDGAGLWVRVLRPHGAPGFIDDTSARTTYSAGWQAAAVNGRVDADATAILIGLSLKGPARAWIDGVSFTTVPDEGPVSGWLAPASAPVNLNFREGLGTVSAGWQVNPGNMPDGYTTEVRREGCRAAPQCAVLIAPKVPKRPNATGNLVQRFDAGPYRGKVLKVGAWLRAESADPAAFAGLWLRVDDFVEWFTTNENPVRPGDWQKRELVARIDPRARTILLGVASHVAAETWVDGVSVEVDPSAISSPSPVSLAFEDAAPGKPPLGWSATPPKWTALYGVRTTREGCQTGPVCVTVTAPQSAPPAAIYNFMRTNQSVSRIDHQFRLRAWVKLDAPSPNSTAQMWFRMDRADGSSGSYAVADSPAPGSGWVLRELTGKVDHDAISISFGFVSRGEGTMSVDNVSLDFFD